MICSKCGASNQDDARFCASCGTAMLSVRFCPACGSRLPDGARFCAQCGAPSPAATPVALHPVVERTSVYAGFWRRAVALLIDDVFVAIVALVISLPLGTLLEAWLLAVAVNADTVRLTTSLCTRLLAFVLSWLYHAFLESSARQATLGKMALGVRVTDLNGSRISFVRATGRYAAKFLWMTVMAMLFTLTGSTVQPDDLFSVVIAIVYLVSALGWGIGYLLAAFTEKKQALHDKLAGTLVMRG